LPLHFFLTSDLWPFDWPKFKHFRHLPFLFFPGKQLGGDRGTNVPLP
jgi:hypothetical protein